MRDLGEQRRGRDDLARDAEPALDGACVEERLLERMQLVRAGQAFDRRDRRAVRLDCEHQARIHADAVDQHGARAALPDQAALLGPGQAEVIAEDLEQGVVGERPRPSASAR